MALAIVHFAFGAGALLLACLPLAFYGRRVCAWRLWLVLAGGLWGLAPDAYRISPLYADRLEALHGSRWADAFALHYTLDRPFFESVSLELTTLSILLFFYAVAVLSLACRATSVPDATAVPANSKRD